MLPFEVENLINSWIYELNIAYKQICSFYCPFASIFDFIIQLLAVERKIQFLSHKCSVILSILCIFKSGKMDLNMNEGNTHPSQHTVLYNVLYTYILLYYFLTRTWFKGGKNWKANFSLCFSFSFCYVGVRT